jgi:hypothetical protein
VLFGPDQYISFWVTTADLIPAYSILAAAYVTGILRDRVGNGYGHFEQLVLKIDVRAILGMSVLLAHPSLRTRTPLKLIKLDVNAVVFRS